ncbi:hypothetical protein [Burkholderia mayonis]|uniref:hypothetical protein n=1 Tax=Burkholderia mayonis TaxID=1385591 RepID=UPI00193AB911|nr:hypothetical protein [Burkholderia mayonis]
MAEDPRVNRIRSRISDRTASAKNLFSRKRENDGERVRKFVEQIVDHAPDAELEATTLSAAAVSASHKGVNFRIRQSQNFPL